MSEMRSVVLDCDTGTDDAVAIMLAALHPSLELLGVCTVWGNHDVATTTDNTLRVLDHISRSDVPVIRGRDDLRGADEVRAAKSPADALPLPAPARAETSADHVGRLVETLRSVPRSVALVATGPLSNLAFALSVEPSLVDHITELVVMGGSHLVQAPHGAETNMRNDPLAARSVLNAGLARLVMIPLDATYEAALTAGDCDALDALGTPAATVAATFVRQRIEHYSTVPAMAAAGAAPVHDALTVAYVIDPSVVTLRPAHVTVEVSDVRRGRTHMDFAPRDREPNAMVAVGADRRRFVDLLHEAFAAG